MYTAMKEDCMAFVIFKGGAASEYPKWFWNFMEEHIYEDEDRYSTLINGVEYEFWPEHLVEGVDVFLCNRGGDVLHIDTSVMDRTCFVLGEGICAFIDDCIEYVRYTGERDIYPDWFLQSLSYGYPETIGFNWDAEVHLNTIFLRNANHELTTLSIDRFNELYLSSQNADQAVRSWPGYKRYIRF